MKYWVLAFLICHCGLNSLSAQSGINFATENLDSVLTSAAKEKKPVFLMIYAVWCSHCNKVKNTVFKDSALIKFVNENYIAIQLNGEKPEGRKVMQKYNARSFPSFLYLNAKAELLYSFTGEPTVESFINESRSALIEQNQIPFLKKQFYSDTSNAEKCFAYINTLKKGVQKDIIPNIVKFYLPTQTEQQLLTETNWKIMFLGVNDIKDPYFQFINKHREQYSRIASPKRVDNKMVNGVYTLLNSFVEQRDSANYFKNREYAASLQIKVVDSVLLNYDLDMYAAKNNWPEYIQTAKEKVEIHYWNDYSQLNNVITNYVKHSDKNKKNDKLFLQWANQSNALNDSYTSNYLIAKLYHRLDDDKNAKKYALMANKYATDLALDVKDIKQLLNELETNK